MSKETQLLLGHPIDSLFANSSLKTICFFDKTFLFDTVLLLSNMAPRKKCGRNDDMDEFITDPHPRAQTKELASTIQHLHTHYEPDQRAVRSFITVPVTSVPQPPTSSSTPDTGKLPPFVAVEDDIEDGHEGGNELESCEVEALGLGYLLTAGIQLEGQTQK